MPPFLPPSLPPQSPCLLPATDVTAGKEEKKGEVVGEEGREGWRDMYGKVKLQESVAGGHREVLCSSQLETILSFKGKTFEKEEEWIQKKVVFGALFKKA